MKQTPWFSGAEKPHRTGVFKRRRQLYNFLGHMTNRQVRFALFEDGVWYCEARTAYGALKQRGNPSAYQDEPEWAGLRGEA